MSFEGFKSVAEELIRENQQHSYGLWYCDIRRFKFINDMFGYETGDSFLQYWARSLKECMGAEDTFCRIAADNFCVLASVRNEEELRHRFEKMDQQLKAFSDLKDRRFKPELVSGVYLLRKEDMLKPDINTFMNKANIAQKSVKSLSGSRMAIYDESMKQQELRELEVSQHLETGLVNGEFFIVIQPQYEYTTKEIVGAEALVRWRHPELGVVSPDEFIPLLEKAGRITDLDKFVWEEACRFIRSLIDQGIGENIVPLSVNISRLDLYMPDLSDYLFNLTEKYDLLPSHLKLEITESAYTADSQQLIEAVENLQQRGFVVEMDDFGGGYSSLNILKDVPVDVLKLDMRFLIVDETNSKRGGNILSSIVRMAHWINLPVIAEGVETKEQAEYLESLGCPVMQGYYFARPMPVEEFEELIVMSKTGDIGFEDTKEDNLSAAEFLVANSSTSFLFNNCIGGACLFEYDGTEAEALLINPAFYESLNMSRDMVDSCRTHMTHLFVKDDRESLLNSFDEAIEKGMSTAYIRSVQGTGSTAQWIRGAYHYLASREDKHVIFALIEDVTEQHHSEIRLYEIEAELNALTDDSVHRWRAVQHHVMAGLHMAVLFDYDVASDTMVYCISTIDGRLDEKAITKYVEDQRFEKIHPDDRGRYGALLFRALERPTNSSVEFRTEYFGKEYRWCRANYVSLVDKSGKIHRIIGRVDDVEAEMQFQRQVSKDALTGLLNQTATKAKINSLLKKDQQGVMLIIDIDDFQVINESFGHLFGDSLLREASKEISKLFREVDILGRVGSDEFVVFIPRNLERQILERRTQDIISIFENIDIPQIGTAHACIGISLAEEGGSYDYAALFKKADRALNKAKHKGKGQYVIYDSESYAGGKPLPPYHNKKAEIESRDRMSGHWPQTLASDVFSILYQSENVHEGINAALAHVGNWLDVSRVYIFEKRKKSLFNTFEWCNIGIKSEIDNLQNIQDGDENGDYLYIENFDLDGVFYLRHTEDAPKWQRDLLEPQGIESMLQYGIIKRGDLIGFIGFDECKKDAIWTREQLDVLIRVAQMIAVFLQQLRFDESK